MAKKLYAIDVEEVISYRIEVEAKSAKEAARIAEEKFFDSLREQRFYNWGYATDQNFSTPVELVD